MLEEVPVMPVMESVSWFQYSTKDFTGWPTADDPYALPAPYATRTTSRCCSGSSPNDR